jgi:ribosomal protein S18 acetylase RimI-like enzyme
VTVIRAAGPDDFDAVTALLEELGRPAVTDPETCRQVYARDLEDAETAHLVGEDANGRIVGFCSLHFRPRLNQVSPEAYVPDLIVTEAARSKKVGHALLSEAENRARRRGCHHLTLESAHWRKDAHRFYLAFGLTDDGLSFGKALV